VSHLAQLPPGQQALRLARIIWQLIVPKYRGFVAAISSPSVSIDGASRTSFLAKATLRWFGPTLAPASGTNTSRDRDSLPIFTVANAYSSVRVST